MDPGVCDHTGCVRLYGKCCLFASFFLFNFVQNNYRFFWVAAAHFVVEFGQNYDHQGRLRVERGLPNDAGPGQQ